MALIWTCNVHVCVLQHCMFFLKGQFGFKTDNGIQVIKLSNYNNTTI